DERLPDLVDLRVEPKRCLEPFDGFGESCVTLRDERLGAVSVSLEIAISGERVLQFSTDERGFGARGVEDPFLAALERAQLTARFLELLPRGGDVLLALLDRSFGLGDLALDLGKARHGAGEALRLRLSAFDLLLILRVLALEALDVSPKRIS